MGIVLEGIKMNKKLQMPEWIINLMHFCLMVKT